MELDCECLTPLWAEKRANWIKRMAIALIGAISAAIHYRPLSVDNDAASIAYLCCATIGYWFCVWQAKWVKFGLPDKPFVTISYHPQVFRFRSFWRSLLPLQMFRLLHRPWRRRSHQTICYGRRWLWHYRRPMSGHLQTWRGELARQISMTFPILTLPQRCRAAVYGMVGGRTVFTCELYEKIDSRKSPVYAPYVNIYIKRASCPLKGKNILNKIFWSIFWPIRGLTTASTHFSIFRWPLPIHRDDRRRRFIVETTDEAREAGKQEKSFRGLRNL